MANTPRKKTGLTTDKARGPRGQAKNQPRPPTKTRQNPGGRRSGSDSNASRRTRGG